MKNLQIFLFFSLTFLLAGEQKNFVELSEMVASEVGEHIYVDHDIPEFKVIIPENGFRKEGEIFQYYKQVLEENNLKLVYFPKGDFYKIQTIKKPIEAVAPIPIHESIKKHYYTYKIEHITNQDVQNSLSVFDNIKYKFLAQSDMISYSATKEQHQNILRVLHAVDNDTQHKTIKLTMFTVNKDKLKDFGFTVDKFGLTLDGFVKNVIGHGLLTDPSRLEGSAYYNSYFSAIEQKGIVDVKQSPTILLTNGVEASFKSVTNIPYLKTSSSVESNQNTYTEQYDYKDVGFQIILKPKIKDDWVYLDMNLISEELISSDSDKPVTQKISYKNSVKLKDDTPLLLTGFKKLIKKNIMSPFVKTT